jgi:hypothetical protein
MKLQSASAASVECIMIAGQMVMVRIPYPRKFCLPSEANDNPSGFADIDVAAGYGGIPAWKARHH